MFNNSNFSTNVSVKRTNYGSRSSDEAFIYGISILGYGPLLPVSSPSLTCSVPGGCSVLACAPPSAKGDETETVLTPETPRRTP
jgi:hypothetical protein